MEVEVEVEVEYRLGEWRNGGMGNRNPSGCLHHTLALLRGQRAQRRLENEFMACLNGIQPYGRYPMSAIRAFCACRRFSAWSKMPEPRERAASYVISSP